ncbi:MAG: hypothetical protein V3T96_02145 [Thermodesulfobacteriota bacterium]
MANKFKSNIVRSLIKPFLVALFLILFARLIEILLSGDVVMATYKIVIALPIVITLLVWLSERTSISEIEIVDKGIKVTSRHGVSLGMPWKTLSYAKHKRRTIIFPPPLWEFRDKEGSVLYIPSGLFSRNNEAKLSSLIKEYLSKHNIGTEI